MYNVLIADDEPEILDGLKILIDWDSMGFQVADTASNGKEALEKIKTGSYRLLITDIRMPGISGLDLIAAVHEWNPGLKIIILSGYDEFDYAKRAIQLGVKAYLLKPVDTDELQALVKEAKEELTEETLRQQSERSLEKISRDKFLYDLTEGQLDLTKFEKQTLNFGLRFEEEGYCCALLDIENLGAATDDSIEFSNLYRFAVRNMAEDIIQATNLGSIYEDSEGLIGVLFRGKPAAKSIRESLMQICENARRHLGLHVIAGVGGTVDDVCGLSRSKKQAKQALDTVFFIGDMNLSFYSDIQINEKIVGELNEIFSSLIETLRELDVDKIEGAVDGVINSIKSGRITPEVTRALSYSFLFSICSFIREFRGECEEVLEESEMNLSAGDRLTVEEIREWMLSVCMKTVKYIAELSGVRSIKIQERIKNYIDENYNDDITIKSLAAVFYLNPAYLGQLLKNTLGESFSDYLNKKRIKEIKRMILMDGYKVYDAIERAGYKNTEHFYRQFKKYESISFADYKRKLEA